MDEEYVHIAYSPVNYELQAMPYETLSAYNFFQGEIKNLNPVYGVLPYELINPLFTDYSDKNRFVWIDDAVMKNQEESIKYKNDDKEAHSQVRYLRARVEKLEVELFEERKRHDTIILSLTEQNQLLLHQNTPKKPFWQFW